MKIEILGMVDYHVQYNKVGILDNNFIKWVIFNKSGVDTKDKENTQIQEIKNNFLSIQIYPDDYELIKNNNFKYIGFCDVDFVKYAEQFPDIIFYYNNFYPYAHYEMFIRNRNEITDIESTSLILLGASISS